jgi:hypothetical protein
MIPGQVKTPKSVWLACRAVFNPPLGFHHKITRAQWNAVAEKHNSVVTRTEMPFGMEEQVCPVCAVSLDGISSLTHYEGHGFITVDAYRLSATVSIFTSDCLNPLFLHTCHTGSCTLVVLLHKIF